jgi:hypothetical protein
MSDDQPAGGGICTCFTPQFLQDVLIGETMESVTLNTGFARPAGKGIDLGYVGHAAVEGGIETSNLWIIRVRAMQVFDRQDLAGQVIGSKRDELLQSLEKIVVDPLGGDKIPPTVNQAVSKSMDGRSGVRLSQPGEQVLQG